MKLSCNLFTALNSNLTMAEVEMQWYVLRAVSGKEAKVKEYIDAEINNGRLGGHVSQVLIPTEKVVQIRNGKRIVKERNYLSGYVLVEARLVGEIAHELRNTPQVLGFLGGLDHPTPLRASEVNRILGKVDEMEVDAVDAEIPLLKGNLSRLATVLSAGSQVSSKRLMLRRRRLRLRSKCLAAARAWTLVLRR